MMRLCYLGIQFLDGFTTTADNVRGLLPVMIREAGFRDVQVTKRLRTMFGTIEIVRTAKS